jgi:DNA-binding NtrC family response regulator
VLQEQRFRRLGGREVVTADVRVLAATNRDPRTAIADGKLREDLYYRLNVFTISLPSLRERPEDVPPLARHFAERAAARTGAAVAPFAQETLDVLLAHSWPGNVRELRNSIERAVLLSGGSTVLPEHLPPEVAAARREPRAAHAAGALAQAGVEGGPRLLLQVGATMEESEKEIIRSTLAHTSGNKTRAARMLGISLKTMHNKVKKYQL